METIPLHLNAWPICYISNSAHKKGSIVMNKITCETQGQGSHKISMFITVDSKIYIIVVIVVTTQADRVLHYWWDL